MSATVLHESASELATLTNTFSVSGTPTDPTTVSLTVTTPGGVSTTYTYAAAEITKSSTGVYTKNIACSEDGEWFAVWVGTGAAADVQVVRWTVFPVSNLYASAEAVKSRFGITDTLDDHEVQRAVQVASRQVELDTGWERFYQDGTVQVRTFAADGPYCCRIPVGISTLTGLIVKTDEDDDGTFERTLTVDTDFVVRRPHGHEYDTGWPYTELLLADNYTFPVLKVRHGVQVTARFGWPTVPWQIAEASLIQSHRLFKRKETSSGVLGFDALGATVRLASMDPDYARLIAPFVRHGIA